MNNNYINIINLINPQRESWGFFLSKLEWYNSSEQLLL